MYALTIFIQRPHRQATLLAKGRTQDAVKGCIRSFNQSRNFLLTEHP